MSAARTAEAIKRVLELVKDGRLSDSEAAKLIATLSRSLTRFSDDFWERQFSLLRDGMSPSDLAQLLAAQADQPPGVSVSAPPRPVGPRGTSRLLRIEVESSDGSNVRVNLPLGLANFAMKLIPREAQTAMTEKGLDVGAIQELLRGDMPDGEVVSMEGSDGSSVRVRVE